MLSFRFHQRLHAAGDFDAVFAARCRKHIGPLTVRTRPNGLAYSRLGLIVGRRVGKAVSRNRIKRLLREAFRLGQQDWAGGYDVVIVVRPHVPLTLADYQRMLDTGRQHAKREWGRRSC